MALTLIMLILSVVSQTLVHMTPGTVGFALSSESDKQALLDLKQKLTNGMPNALPSWNQSLHFCEWQGVTCSHRHMRVSVLHLQNQYWGGTLGPSLANLTFLRILILSNINLNGQIPTQIGRLKRLQILDLSHNNLHGDIPIHLTNCSNLQVINLLYNKLTGKVPSWFGIGSMSQLTKLLLGANDLVGTIPHSLGNISSLQNVTLARNHLEGSIPHALGRLSNLNELSLGSNSLSGVVPDSLYNLSNIQNFVLGENQLTGTLPSNMQLAFPNLQVFFVGSNNFSGTFPSSISNITGLQAFDISSNGFTGPIPPTLGSLNKLEIFHVGKNSFGSGRTNDLDFLSSLTNSTRLRVLLLEDNRFGGVLPDLLGNLSTHLRWLSMDVNEISGMIPEGIGELIGLTDFTLVENFIKGMIPNSIGRLKNLVRLALQENELSGNIPTAIGNLTMLSELYLHTNKLEGSIPLSLKYCTRMQSFGVSSNNLSGDIPNQIFGNVEGLINLDLSNNSFTGSIPLEFGNMKHLSVLYLYRNKLSGEIPLQLGACSALTELVLERNFFRGSIPSFLGSLRSLEILDLSNNNLSSTIPGELQNLSLLNTLDLSFNHLYGEVPIGGVFNNVTAISLIGNKDLCGGIPQLKLPECSSLPSKKHKSSLRKKLILIIVIGVGGSLVSFIIFISIYLFMKKPKTLSSSWSWKNKYVKVSYGELHEATNGFSSSNLVGTGSFGSVYRGSLLHFERPIAVKVLNLEIGGASKSFTAECHALGKIKHRNLLKILTCCSSIDYNGVDFKAIVFEFMPNGNLASLLHSNEGLESRNFNLNLQLRLNIALDVANALDYLHHGYEQPVVHCDIKPSNVLLDDEVVAHLGDFGLARLLHVVTGHSSREHVSSSAIKGTIGYVPPEYGAGVRVSPKGDIYSYGILLLEMLTGMRPTDNMFGEGLSLHKFCEMAIPERITEIVDSRLLVQTTEEGTRIRETEIRECLVSFARIGVACSVELPVQRMAIKDVIVDVVSQTMVYMTPGTVGLALSSESDKQALLDLKQKLTNGMPNALPSWNQSLHFCEWQGVTCSHRHMRVSVLHLQNQYWGGTLGPSLANLTFLRILILSNINLNGQIPTQVINLLYNKLTGKVPSWFGIGSMSQLTKLLLGANDLVGTIPHSLGNLSSLQNVTLARNHLEGSIPHALGRLSNLKELNLGLNNLSGVVPVSLYNLSNIQIFVLGRNQLSGTLPSNMHLAFPNLRVFFVGWNNFYGIFPSSISNITGLQAFDISSNGFSGSIPPTLGSLNKLTRFSIAYNSFGSGRAQDLDLDFLSSLTNCTQLRMLLLDNNEFGGVLPDLIGNFSTHLTWLSMGENQISGMIPERIGQLIGLTNLVMVENDLEGTIPDSIGNLKNLVRLALEENKLSGNIPTAIGNLTVLSELYLRTNKLEGSIPLSLKYCTRMQSFGVADNNLRGDIPNQTFGNLEGLINLDLSNNSFTGSIPLEFGNLKHLSVLYLYDNKLSGEIPPQLGACSALTELMLERNFFRGSIPSFLGSLRSLEILDLSNNNFSSTIPGELQNLSFLNTVNLSFNHLYGEVPIGGVFNNITEISLFGNKDLCGGIPQLKLPACSSLPSKKHKWSLGKKLILIIVIGVGGGLVSFIIFISIYLSKRKPKTLSSSRSLQNMYIKISYGELHEATNGFSSSNLIGAGSFGSVYKGSLLHFERPVAVKVLNLETCGASKSFTAECKALGKIKHQNVLNILTFCSSIDYNGDDFKAIVLEFMPNGNLECLLHSNDEFETRNFDLNLQLRVNIALDVANALDYLHRGSEQAVVHCDIKPSNVLLNDEVVAHLGDFGLARLLHVVTGHSSRDHVCSSALKGTIGYIPPEYGAGVQVSPKGDIYSYGILLLEMLTGMRPTDNMFGEGLSLHKFCEMAIPERITEIVDSRLIVPITKERTRVMETNIRECLVSFARIGVSCSAEFPVQRMAIKDVIVELQAIIQKLPPIFVTGN
ncbi:putative LRR receptor-like serine/threonine-protein kinase, partial [Mucuna pruriens]